MQDRSAVTGSPFAPFPDPSEPLPLEPFEAVISRFLAVADAHPLEPAVVRGTTCWTYADLSIAVTGLASELDDLGVRPGDAVAVTGTPCHGLLAVVLAVLARNAVLVPLDPLLPAVRRRDIIERCGTSLLVEAGEREGIGEIALHGLDVRRFTIPAVPTLDDEVVRRATGYRVPEIAGDDPAYLMFTSGTTGEPKGVVGRQRGLSHFLAWERDATGIGPGDRMAQLTSLSFDVVLRDLFLPLTSGAALHLPPLVHGATPPSDLLAFLERDRVTMIHAVPTVASFWLSDLPEGVTLPDLSWVLFAGEPLPGTLVRRWREVFNTPRIGNLYGPTETTLAKCFATVGPEPEPGAQPVGRAIPGAQALVMDGDRLCGPEELGEIVIRTPYRSLGYLGAEGDPRPPFVRNPFTDDPSDLVYRTGDRGRYRSDGVLEIHGRLDDQVKILGVRIEPAEVTAELTAHPAVRAATVVAKEDPRGDTALVAYVVPEDGRLDEAALRRFLADRMLAAKVPRAFVRLAELPRTPNGKVDRRKLPEPDWAGTGSAGRDAATAAASGGRADEEPPVGAPADAPVVRAATVAITEIFGELLGRSDLGPDDDFFRIGGHSLLAARLIQRVESRLGVRLQVRDLFAQPTARGLAGLVADRRPAASPAPAGSGDARPAGAPAPLPDAVVPIRASGSRPPLFVVPGVGSRLLYLRHLARQLGPEQPLYALHTRFLDDGTVYERIEDLAALYVRGVRAVAPSGPYRLLGHSYGGLVALEVACQLRRAGAEVAFLGVVDTRLPDLREHAPWSIRRSIPRRLLNLAAILQPLSGPARRTYLRTRLRVARVAAQALVTGWLSGILPAPIRRWAPANPHGREEVEWLAADLGAQGRYAPCRYPGRITYFWAAHSQRPPSVVDRREGWDALAGGGLDVRVIPGNHLTVMAEPLIRSTGAAIRDALEASSPRAASRGD